MLDPANPGFAELLERARAAGLEAAKKADSHGTYSTALATFSAELNEGHAQAFALPLPTGLAPPVKAEWPGFLPVWRQGALVVRDAAPDSPVPTGTRILSCDGIGIRDFLSQRLRTRYIRPREEGQFWSRGPLAFYTAPTSTTRARECRVSTPDGAERDLKLTWSEAPANWRERFNFALSGDRLPIGLTEPRTGLFHVALPDFQPDDKGAETYKAMFEQIDKQHARLSAGRAVVLDLRYNNGGSSSWSYKLARRLWGDAEVDGAMERYFAGTEIWWRPTEETIAHLRENAALARRRGETQSAERQEKFVAEMEATRERNQPFHIQKFGALPMSERSMAPVKGKLAAPVYVIMPGYCASACLDALDVFTRFEGVKLVGAPTSGDSTYMEVRLQDLPSGRGRLVVPVKVWVHRPRGNGEVYQPHIAMNGLDWSTAAFLDRIEKDLARTR
ncbi:MAG TPA: S41 family peptidase [Allosphingosinicella sp.]|jgi:hypothetical protein